MQKAKGKIKRHINKKSNWSDYELLDCGSHKKLERFGDVILIRPEPGAIWNAQWEYSKWQRLAHAECNQLSNNKANWNKLKPIPPKWKIDYPLGAKNISFNLQLTSFKHVGIFPEQHVNWNIIYDEVTKIGPKARVLNLFAYTGGASLAAKRAGADVVHVDSIKQVVSWAKTNMETSHLKDIRWVVEDALKFVAREHKRGNKYDGVILDPPAFGMGAKGERWKLENSINELLRNVSGVIEPNKHFVVLNTYSPGFTPLVIENLLKNHFSTSQVSARELYLKSETDFRMPTGVSGLVKK